MAKAIGSTKFCPKCKTTKDCEAFGRDRTVADGIKCWCKACCSAATVERQRKNPERQRATVRRQREKDPAAARAKRHAQYLKNIEAVAAQTKAWREANIERAKETSKAWIDRNKQHYLAYRAIAASKRRATDPEKYRKQGRAYYKRYPEIWKAARDRYRAVKREASGTYTTADIVRIRADQNGRCAYCRSKLLKTAHIDHIHPLSQGGSNEPRNLQLTCAGCNQRKKDKDPIKFAQQLGRLL